MSDKTVTISGRSYTIKTMTPQAACLIRGQLVGASFKFARGSQSDVESQTPRASITAENVAQRAEEAVEGMWSIVPASLPKEMCEQIQRDALRCCYYVMSEATPNVQSPVLMADGRFADTALAEDAASVDELIIESLKFSVGPLFIKGMLKAAMEASPKTIN